MTSVKKPKPTGKQTARIDKGCKISAFFKRKRTEDDQILLDKQTMNVVAASDCQNLGELTSNNPDVPCKRRKTDDNCDQPCQQTLQVCDSAPGRLESKPQQQQHAVPAKQRVGEWGRFCLGEGISLVADSRRWDVLQVVH